MTHAPARLATLAAAPIPAGPLSPDASFAAAQNLLAALERGKRVDAPMLRAAMEFAFGGSDAQGAWDWKMAYDACEAATVLFLRKFGPAMQARAGSPAALLAMLTKIAGLLPTHTRRSEESQALQQFSTPIALGLVARVAAAITPADLVLEPSAGTGLLAILAELAGGSLVLNELAETRAGLLGHLFPGVAVTRFDAAQIDDYLDVGVTPSVVLMNPPFSALANVDRQMAGAALRHISSALARLTEGGRLVAITGASCAPDNPSWTEHFVRLQERGRVVFSAAIDGAVFAKHGTTIDTRLTVIDRLPAADPTSLPASPGIAPDVATLLGWVTQLVPARLILAAPVSVSSAVRPMIARAPHAIAARPAPLPAKTSDPEVLELAYETVEWKPLEGRSLTEALYEEYGLQSIRIPESRVHPTKLVQSAAMASVAPPKPTYRPHLPASIISSGLLSDAQLESVIQAGEAHGGRLAGFWTVDETFDNVSAASDDAENAFQFRRGWFLGDGTGAGKGRQVAGILLDNWLKGRRRAVWVSKSDKLIEDAQRDWSALGQERLLVTPLSRFRQGAPIRLAEGILFTTYATLRSDARDEKVSRVRQIVDWLGGDFDGVIIFDESHAMQNAAGCKGERGDQAASQQGRAGLRLQHALPDARVVYVSATGATTVHNLAYAQRLGLWGGEDFPFATRSEFVEAIEAGGVAAMEVLARDMKALGLYAARSLSYEGVEYDMLEHQLTDEQIRIYDAYAGAFSIIHNNLAAALEATNITGETGTLNRQAKSAARSAFESAKQRFFNHLITAMKTPSLIAAIDHDLAAGHASVIQIVSTGEALMERRLAEIPTEDWGDVQVDITPREYVLDYLAHSFPTQLYEPFTDGEGNLSSRPVFRDGQPVQSRDAAARRDRLIEKLASLPPVHGALDQIVQRFGADLVAEVTGRSRRIIRKTGSDRVDRLVVENRAGSANLAETQAFMDDVKRILVFSDAGGTGRSYHAELSAKNRRLRVHYLLEAGWKADAAIQGLGRTNRTNQAQPPLFRPIATNVKAEKRFLSTIARRLDTLGAITKGQRQTGGQGLFRPEDNLESFYARDALRQLYLLLVNGKVENCSLAAFEEATGLALTDSNGIKDDLPPITTFLNRLLALTIELQNILFTAFEQLLTARIEGAIASGTYDVGLETLTAESFVVTDRRTIYTHPGTSAETTLLTITQRERNRPVTLEDALDRLSDPRTKLLVNSQSGRAAVQVPSPSVMLDDGEVERRVRLIRPMEHPSLALGMMPQTHWQEADRATFVRAWLAELADVPEFTESQIHIVSGLLLPIWKRLPNESSRVYRLQTDVGERIVGRKVSAAWAAIALETGPTSLSPEGAFAALIEGKTILDLSEGLQLRRVRVMGVNRIEMTGFTDMMRDRLRAYGLFGEIISWKLRMFVPTDAAGPEVLGKVLERYPLERIAERAAA
ncbi:strawberry notch family protein [Rhodoblastus acidophilus]|uniref:Strawberry notch family protein n=1 Tax=Candidatus Rhodoblastus alkanivorans TaxID=2954117 RepID=A0ABS9ZE17_9HYPH|nr:strawberry notch family protein [Candidatus Rhodoblastus alkanivorans]MCI4679095.1 strawberry notch family protein [Candidatus Rhodoblastus alkanivorans]MCI4685021.1 strawberry notch family protein [Candidatus Rhodoblastus alkanivorans]MDI4643211.1 strawberry notch family protein [Rhodoblastus acidophilus]